PFPGLGSLTIIMGYFLRLLQLLSTCVAFSLVAGVSTLQAAAGNWSIFVWCFCFVVTLIILIVELCRLQSRLHLSWDGFLITSASCATLLCLSGSIVFATACIQLLPHSPFGDHAIAITVFSSLASVAYATEVVWTCARSGEFSCSVLTLTGLLHRLEIFVACVIFAFISSPHLYVHQPALEWCVAVYSICFLLSAVTLLLNWYNWDNRLPVPVPLVHLGLTLLSTLLYASAVVLWPLYQFNGEFGGQPQRSSDMSCHDKLTSYICTWDQRLAVAILTAVNLLIYVVDLVDLARRFFLSASEALHQAPRFPLIANGSSVAAHLNGLMWAVLLKVWSLDQQQGINRKFWGMQIPRFPHHDLLNQKLDGPSSPQVMLNLVQCANGQVMGLLLFNQEFLKDEPDLVYLDPQPLI
ncbi:myeloid-associated differentiation marker-like, partial [Oryx dammah]|uniref:myeloid-associated differentiation marker-like n=1 Tax=Oryx dammah TaxID=59534 RepID=UPI001A9AED94